MKTSTLRALAISSLIANLTPLSIMAQQSSHFVTPFEFTAGAKSLPAGDYYIKQSGQSVLQVSSADAKFSVSFLANSDEPNTKSDRGTLTFRRYNDRYFLAAVSDCNQGWRLPPSRKEKELMASRVAGKPLTILATTRK